MAAYSYTKQNAMKHLTPHKLASLALHECHSLLFRRRAGDEALSSFAALRMTLRLKNKKKQTKLHFLYGNKFYICTYKIPI
jgi:hypothetical protein